MGKKMKKKILVILIFNIMGCVTKEDIRVNTDLTKAFNKLAEDAFNKKDYTQSCRYTKTLLDKAKNIGDNNEIKRLKINEDIVCNIAANSKILDQQSSNTGELNKDKTTEKNSKYDAEKAIYYYELADKENKNKNNELACSYSLTSLEHANKTGNTDIIKIANNNKSIFCNKEVSKEPAQKLIVTNNDLLGNWYNVTELSKHDISEKKIYVQDFYANEEMIEHKQDILDSRSFNNKIFSCTITSTWNWSISENILYQKKITENVHADWVKINGNKYTNDVDLTNICNVMEKFEKESLMKTFRTIIQSIDDKKIDYQVEDSKGQLGKLTTDYRTTKSLSYYRIK
jgi:hypothetical protein